MEGYKEEKDRRWGQRLRKRRIDAVGKQAQAYT